MVWKVTGLAADHTQDVQVSVKNHIVANWNLSAPLSVGLIQFDTGWYDQQWQFQVHFRHDYFPGESKKTIGRNYIHKYDDFVNIHVFVQMQHDNTEPEELGKIYREIERIIGTDVTALQATQGFNFMSFIQPMHTLPIDVNEETHFHGFGTIMLRYHKVNA